MQLDPTSALVVLSGGQDSTTCLFLSRTLYKHVHAITFDYGQRHRRELVAAVRVAAMANVESHEMVVLPDGVLLSTSPLTDPNAELETYADFKSMAKTIGKRIEVTFVPMRNAVFLMLAANRAVALGCQTIIVGVCEEDNANYPDCRKSFIETAEKTVNSALGLTWTGPDRLAVLAPLIDKTKADTVRLARTLPGCTEALAYSHTCYAGAFPRCGKCHACVLRAEGFRAANLPDPLLARVQLNAEATNAVQ